MMKGDNLTDQFLRRTNLTMVGRSRIRASFALLGKRSESEIRRPGPSPPAPPRNLPAWDVFSYASEYDVAEQQRPATQHDEVAMRSFQLPFVAEADVVDAIDQRRVGAPR
jgi:hypothetical protein